MYTCSEVTLVNENNGISIISNKISQNRFTPLLGSSLKKYKTTQQNNEKQNRNTSFIQTMYCGCFQSFPFPAIKSFAIINTARYIVQTQKQCARIKKNTTPNRNKNKSTRFDASSDIKTIQQILISSQNKINSKIACSKWQEDQKKR